MLVALVISLVVAGDSASRAEDLQSYEIAAAKAGRNAESHVRLAIWCEAHGMEAERATHLAMAVIADPENATARGLQGMVRDGDRWTKLEAATALASEREKTDKLRAEYLEKRDKATKTADSQWKLALWCDQNGLKPEATAHAFAATKIDANHELAWKYLSYKKRDGRWLTEDQIAAERAEAKKEDEANRKWRPLLLKWRDWLKNSHLKTDAQKQLASINDPHAVASILKVFGTNQAADQTLAIQLLGQIDGRNASQALLNFAYFGNTSEIRRIATETLMRRDVREFLDTVIAQIRKVLKYEVRRVEGPGSPGVLFVEGEKYNVRRLYDPVDFPDFLKARYQSMANQNASNFFVPLDVTEQNAMQSFFVRGPRGEMIPRADAMIPILQLRREMQFANDQAEMSKSIRSAEAQLENDVATLDRANALAALTNERSQTILSQVSSQDFGSDRDAWSRWWIDEQGFEIQQDQREVTGTTQKPTFDQEVPPDYSPTYRVMHSACFAAGTPVTTKQGRRPIEQIQVGDMVLSQNATSGRLSFEPVVGVYHNPPAATLRLRIGSDDVVSTGIHRFWKVGKGWVMARNLKPTDRLRSAGNVVQVSSVSPEKTQKVYNLDVASGHSFFVGDVGVLVHDHSLAEVVPDAFDSLQAIAKAK